MENLSQKITCLSLLVVLMAGAALAQRPRSISNDPAKPADPTQQSLPPAPQTVKAKYEGGVFGYNKRMNGTLTFDDTNRRLLFRNQAQKDVLFIPYDAITAAFADKQARRPAAATVASSVPLIYAWPAAFIKKKYDYLTLQYSDPDTKVAGITSFKLENKEVLASVLSALAGKANLTQHGQVFKRVTSAPEQP